MKTRVKTGLEELFVSVPPAYRDARVGVLCNQASVDARWIHCLDRFAACRHFRLTTGFGPQHGARGDKQDNMIESEDYVDARLGIPVFSLYGEHRKPTPEMLAEVDVLFCDLADVGTRVYTFIYTMALAMQACAEAGKPVVVLDRPNPIGGQEVEGSILDPDFRSFVGMYPIPMRHGLTIGELARLFNVEFGIGAQLEVIPVQGWSREQWWDETGLPWVMPSPNMPTLETAAVYPGMVLIEGTLLSEGRGTTRPFELVGAPYIEAEALATRLNGMQLPGIHFRPARFQPTFQKWAGELCGGVQLHVTSRRFFRPVLTGLAILKAALELYPEHFQWRQPPYEYEYKKLPIDILCGTDYLRESLQEGATLQALEAWSAPGLEEFRRLRENYLLYR